MTDLRIVGKRVLVKLEERGSVGKGGIIFSAVKDDLLKGRVLHSGCMDIKKDDRVYFKKFGGIKFEDLIVVEEKDILIKMSNK